MEYFSIRPPTRLPKTILNPRLNKTKRILHAGIQSPYFYNTDESDDGNHLDDYGYDDERNEERIKKTWLSKAVALCRHLWPSVKHDDLSVDFLDYGANNSVFSISLPAKGGKTTEYVLRIPECDMNITRTVGILEYLTKYTKLSVPRVIAADATIHNPLGHAYIILSRLPGKSLAHAWKDLTHGQKIRLAHKLAELYHQIESVVNPFAGVIKAHRQEVKYHDEAVDQNFVEAFGASTIESHANPVNWTTPKDGTLPLRLDRAGSSVNHIMLAIFERRIYEKKNRKSTDDFMLKWYELCQRIVEDMVGMGLFDYQKCDVCLCHPDLFPRNIMVDFSPEITITGVLDWDDAMFVPRFAGRVLPRWLWQSGLESEPGSNTYETEPLNSSENEPNSPQNAEIKLAFDSAVGEGWLSEATSEWFRLARALLKFSREGITHASIFENLVIWKDKWKSLSTDAVENLYFWTEKRNLSIFEETDEAFPNWTGNEETSCKDDSTDSWDDHPRTQFKRILSWIISMPASPRYLEEQHSGESIPISLIEDDDSISSSETSSPETPCNDSDSTSYIIKTNAMSQYSTLCKPSFIKSSLDDHCLIIP